MGRQRGYTIIEVILFLAISAMLLATVLFAFTNSVTNNRATDTIRSFEAFVFQQLSDVRSSVVETIPESNGRVLNCVPPGTTLTHVAGTSDDCLVMGKVIQLPSSGSTRVFNILGNITPVTGNTCGEEPANATFTALLRYCPRILDMAKPIATYQPEWQATVSKVQFLNTSTPPSPQDFNNVASIAIIRDPASEIVYITPFSSNQSIGELKLGTTLIQSQYTNTPGVICVTMSNSLGKKGQVVFGGGEGTGSISSSVGGVLPAGLSPC